MNRIVLSCLLLVAALSACDGGAAPVAGASDPIRVANGAATSDLAFNALASGRAANRALTSVPLHEASFAPGGHGDLLLPLHDPAARTFMDYLVRCALAPGQVIHWQDPFDGQSYKFFGEVGLCPAWHGAAPTPECLEAASSCVLARNNAYGLHVDVELSGLRPETSDALPPDPSGIAYPIHEGAFFGTIFDPSVLPVDVTVDPAKGDVLGRPEAGQAPEVAFPRMYACSGPVWATAAAYMRHRVCASARRETACLARYAGPCDGDAGWQRVCARKDAKQLWSECVGPDGQPWLWPISVSLDSPTAVVKDQNVTAFVAK